MTTKKARRPKPEPIPPIEDCPQWIAEWLKKVRENPAPPTAAPAPNRGAGSDPIYP